MKLILFLIATIAVAIFAAEEEAKVESKVDVKDDAAAAAAKTKLLLQEKWNKYKVILMNDK